MTNQNKLDTESFLDRCYINYIHNKVFVFKNSDLKGNFEIWSIKTLKNYLQVLDNDN